MFASSDSTSDSSPSSLSIDIADTTRSFSAVRNNVTPAVLRPAIRTSRTGVRIILPPSVTMIMSLSSATGKEPATAVFLPPSLIFVKPPPPRCVVRYSYELVRLPNPFSDTVKINCSAAAIRAICSSVNVSVVASSSSSPASSSMPVAARRNARLCLIYAPRMAASDSPCVNIAIPIILSSAPNVIPRTPVELRPANTRISDTGNRMQRPRYVAKNTSWSSVHGRTEIKLSPSSNFIAILPFARIESKSDVRLRRTVPDAVANIR